MIDSERAQQVIRDGGKLSWAEYLRMHAGCFTRGGALGSESFLDVLQSDGVRSRNGRALEGLGDARVPIFTLRRSKV